MIDWAAVKPQHKHPDFDQLTDTETQNEIAFVKSWNDAIRQNI